MGQSRQYLLVVGLGCYKWYRAKHRAMCQEGRWAPKGDGLRDPKLVGEGNETFLIRMWNLTLVDAF